MSGLRNGNMEVSKKLIAVAIEKSKGSQIALKWAIDNALQNCQNIVLIHVNLHPSITSLEASPSVSSSRFIGQNVDEVTGQTMISAQHKELFQPFHCFCTRKDIQCHDVLLEDIDLGKSLIDYVTQSAIDVLVVGASSKQSFLSRFKMGTDLQGSLMKGIPDFCNLYVINRGKISSSKAATSQPPAFSHLRNRIFNNPNPAALFQPDSRGSSPRPQNENKVKVLKKMKSIKSPFYKKWPHGEIARRGTVSLDISNCNELSFDFGGGDSVEGVRSQSMDMDFNSYSSNGSYQSSEFRIQDDEDINEMLRLKQQLKQTMEMYSTACKEANTATQKANELQLEKLERAGITNKTTIENEKTKSNEASEDAQVAQRDAQLETEKKINSVETKANRDTDDMNKLVVSNIGLGDSCGPLNCKTYNIQDIKTATLNFSETVKIGEGGFGFVYKAVLDEIPVAIKVLRPDAAQGRLQFQREVEVLSNIRHPNMVLLLGICPEYGCLIYEYLSNGSLDDLLFKRGNSPPLTWKQRFKISFEIANGLLFLHQSKPEPIVHRDLKPANILLDSNYVSKISDVGLARLVPPSSTTQNTTQYHMTSAAGTFCYIDPEYQQTGLLGVKSDVYSLGVMLLQIITAKSPMGLTHSVEKAIEKGNFGQMLDPTVFDWPVEEALSFAKMALKCTELRRRDRPDLEKEILPELMRLRDLADR